METVIIREVFYQGQPLSYQLTRKRVKNLNLRVKEDGRVLVSCSPRCSLQRVDAFVLEKAPFILRARQRVAVRRAQADAVALRSESYSDAYCMAFFGALLEKWMPVFQSLGVKKPVLRMRRMKARWGSCLVQKGIITLNRRLIAQPPEAIEYVVVHELCHFLHPNHGAAFYALVEQLLPDYRARRELLREG